MAYSPELIGDLHKSHLGKVPDVRRKLARMTRTRGELRRDVLVEVLVDGVDEDGDGR